VQGAKECRGRKVLEGARSARCERSEGDARVHVMKGLQVLQEHRR
jgi:hypothetical protein